MQGENLIFSRVRELISKNKLASIIIVGIVVRIVLMPISAHPYDMYVWYDMSQKIVQQGPLSFQLFPPVNSYFMLIPISYVYNWFASVFSIKPFSMSSLPPVLNFYPSQNATVVPDFLFNFLIKLPLLVSDTLAALLIYRIVNKMTDKKGLAEKAAFLWFLNPYLIWISAAWGMWDSMAAMFSLLSVYFLINKKITLSAICLVLGVVTKLYPLMFLLPITFYFLRSNRSGKIKNLAKFYFVFIASLMLFVFPFIDEAANFFGFLFVPSQVVVVGFASNPVTNPVAFGLTYWSVFLLNRTVSSPQIGAFVFLVSGFLLVISGTLAFKKINKMTFLNCEFDLVTSMLFCVIALFLSFRLVLEPWFVWALPFLIILCVGGKVRRVFYWGASLTALFYAFLNCPLPFFFLPMAPWIGNSLVSSVNFLLGIDSIRIFLLAILGCIFSILLFLILVGVNKPSKTDKVQSAQV
jgi:Gpi18-like mannosyltransferase